MLAQKIRFDDGLSQLLDIHRYPVGFIGDVLDDFSWQRFAASVVCNQLLDFSALQAIQSQRREVRAQRPRRAKLWPIGHNNHQRYGRALLDLQADQLQRRRVSPVQVFPDLQHRLTLSFFKQPGDDLIKGTAPLLLRGQGQHRTAFR